MTHPNRAARRSMAKQARRKPARAAGYALVDAQARHAENPATFALPFAEEITALRPGHYAKIAVEPNDGYGERFWC